MDPFTYCVINFHIWTGLDVKSSYYHSDAYCMTQINLLASISALNMANFTHKKRPVITQTIHAPTLLALQTKEPGAFEACNIFFFNPEINKTVLK